MKSTVTALYETREDAERARDALNAAHLGAQVQLCDQTADEARRHKSGVAGWMSDLFGGHRDHHLYAEGLRRGHFLVTAKVDDLNEARAAVIMDAAAMNLSATVQTWQSEGWSSEAAWREADTHPRSRPSQIDSGPSSSGSNPYTQTFGGVRTYTL